MRARNAHEVRVKVASLIPMMVMVVMVVAMRQRRKKRRKKKRRRRNALQMRVAVICIPRSAKLPDI